MSERGKGTRRNTNKHKMIIGYVNITSVITFHLTSGIIVVENGKKEGLRILN